jgi:hypothetical protein
MYYHRKVIILLAIVTNTVLATIALGSLELQKNKPLLNGTLTFSNPSNLPYQPLLTNLSKIQSPGSKATTLASGTTT